MQFRGTFLFVGALCLYLLTPLAQAGGLWISEYGTPAQGRAGAGAEAGTDDASAGFYNPASMSRLDRSQMMASVGVAAAKLEFDIDSAIVPGGDGGDAGSTAPLASFFYVRPLDDRWSIGASMAGLTGATLDYGSDWVGRFQVEEVELLGIVLEPSVSYRIDDQWSVGWSLPVMYTSLDEKVAIPARPVPDAQQGRVRIDGDDWKVSFKLGVLYELSEATRIGLTYLHGFDAKYGGDVDIRLPNLPSGPQEVSVGADTSLDFAPVARLSLAHEFSDAVRGYATFGWEGWSSLDNVNIATRSNGAVLEKNWDDTYKYAVGAEVDLSPRWTVSGGLAYDTNPVDAQDRTADMPIDRQIRYAVGVRHTRPSGLKLGAEFTYADYGSAKIRATGFSGDYKSNEILFFAVNASWELDKTR